MKARLQTFTKSLIAESKKLKLTGNLAVDRVIKKYIKAWESDGRVIFNSVEDDDFYTFTEFLESKGVDYGETSQTGTDIVVYDTKRWDSSLKKIREASEDTDRSDRFDPDELEKWLKKEFKLGQMDVGKISEMFLYDDETGILSKISFAVIDAVGAGNDGKQMEKIISSIIKYWDKHK